jgi:hypothetical protein
MPAMSCPRFLRRRTVAAGLCFAILAASVAFGDFYAVRAVISTVPGIDALGNPSLLLGADGPGKSYKDINTGIIVQINRAQVTNQWPMPMAPALCKPKNFHNLGVPILDPQTGETFTTTSDALFVRGMRTRGTTTIAGWFGYLVAVYDPRFPVLESELEI